MHCLPFSRITIKFTGISHHEMHAIFRVNMTTIPRVLKTGSYNEIWKLLTSKKFWIHWQEQVERISWNLDSKWTWPWRSRSPTPTPPHPTPPHPHPPTHPNHPNPTPTPTPTHPHPPPPPPPKDRSRQRCGGKWSSSCSTNSNCISGGSRLHHTSVPNFRCDTQSALPAFGLSSKIVRWIYYANQPFRDYFDGNKTVCLKK